MRDNDRFHIWLGQFNGEVEVIVRKKVNKRTDRQNRALHLYFTQVAEALNEAGYDMKKTLKHDVDIPWQSETVKEYIWRKVQIAYLRKPSTTQLTTKELDKVYEVVNRMLGEKTSVYVPFPSLETLLEQDNNSI